MFVFDIKKYYFEKNSKMNIFFTNLLEKTIICI